MDAVGGAGAAPDHYAVPASGATTSLAASSNGELVAVGDAAGVVHVWTDRQMARVNMYSQPTEHVSVYPLTSTGWDIDDEGPLPSSSALNHNASSSSNFSLGWVDPMDAKLWDAAPLTHAGSDRRGAAKKAEGIHHASRTTAATATAAGWLAATGTVTVAAAAAADAYHAHGSSADSAASSSSAPLSSWPSLTAEGASSQWAYRPLPPLDAGLIPGLKYRGNDYLGVAPNPGGQFLRNHLGSLRRFCVVQRKSLSSGGGGGGAGTGLGSGLGGSGMGGAKGAYLRGPRCTEAEEAAYRREYARVTLPPNQRPDSFDPRAFNGTRLAGLDNSLPNAFANATVQVTRGKSSRGYCFLIESLSCMCNCFCYQSTIQSV